MQKVPTFSKGGVHPDDKKVYSRSQSIERLPMPSELIVALSQHLGAPAKAIKAKGDTVLKGEKIGESAGFISSDVHSPVSGVIKEIRRVTLANSVQCDAFVIVPDAEQPDQQSEKLDWKEQSSADLLAKIKDLGIVGMGGATFPAHVKFSVPRDKKVEAFVVNGVECEPYLTADYRIMLEKGEEALEGAMICAKITGAQRVIIGIELNKPDCIAHLNEIIKQKGYPIEIMGLKIKYPQGDEKQLLKATIHREIPSGKLPLDVGAVVANIGTCNAIYEAIVLGKSLYERVISVTGECIANPKNILAPVGTKVSDLLAFCGGFKSEPEKLVSGGPMMGFSFFDTETPITKGSSGLLALPPQKKVRTTACLNCGRCVAACPIGLMPAKLYRLINNGHYEEAMQTSLMDCKECGCCSFVCPAHLPLVHTMKTGKKLGRKKK
ncbi:electron transport complex subunit RsxC [Sphaerochaeta globosa]|jgi:electron transport complex protein RnfC|uniref:Ion-translocating oxidoreductase complex subunit C n=1 Tax=Sphaerochaeta globosa (strain ATCC BAA-1886 / DSM 22777 / Buddy) TaxID=158189 RepID=F0RVU7_SPHGB|nr:electron transport complex subunit RsxC [Sphaerochaeta globosa]ADY13159.1 electron transport complex, RnfABCDGE type, C subunit [Sphaerochaeta globosa str. Buddy]